eukprot:TRINITY_DN5342_c0_g1_i1.p1 TRINITY_DN5342_c0_g1~~TRINITY_DN5342_c0_g1_i1.p1  ORF type:complete len:384 (+),score=80.77 TRINITY_DN5342_c0_g1_i1:63-1214(+)
MQARAVVFEFQPQTGAMPEADTQALEEESVPVDLDSITMKGEVTKTSSDEIGEPPADTPKSSHRLKMKSPPSMVFSIIMIFTGFFYIFHHRKLHEKGGGGMIMSRLEREYTNLGILAALMMAIVFSQGYVMHDAIELFGLDSVSGIHEGTSWVYNVQFCLMIVAGVGEVLALIFSIINLVTLNLVAEDEFLIYLEHAGWIIRLPVLFLIYGTLTWVLNIMFYIYHLTSPTLGIIFNGLCVLCALLVFFSWGKLMQATYIASQHTELLDLGLDKLPQLPGFFRPGGSAKDEEVVQQEINKLEEGNASQNFREQKLVRRLSSSKLSIGKKSMFAISEPVSTDDKASSRRLPHASTFAISEPVSTDDKASSRRLPHANTTDVSYVV